MCIISPSFSDSSSENLFGKFENFIGNYYGNHFILAYQYFYCTCTNQWENGNVWAKSYAIIEIVILTLIHGDQTFNGPNKWPQMATVWDLLVQEFLITQAEVVGSLDNYCLYCGFHPYLEGQIFIQCNQYKLMSKINLTRMVCLGTKHQRRPPDRLNQYSFAEVLYWEYSRISLSSVLMGVQQKANNLKEGQTFESQCRKNKFNLLLKVFVIVIPKQIVWMCTTRLEVVTGMMECMRSGHAMLQNRFKCTVHSTAKDSGRKSRNAWMGALISRFQFFLDNSGNIFPGYVFFLIFHNIHQQQENRINKFLY